jgi:hypothetical protein
MGKEGLEARKRHVINPGSLADDHARIAAGDILIEQLARHHNQSRKAKTRHFLITFCWDAGLLPDGAKEVPNLKAMRLDVYKALADLGLSGIGVLEVSPLRSTKTNPAMLIAHFHVIGWTSDLKFRPRKAAQRLSEKAKFHNSLGAPGVTIRSRKASAKNFNKKSDAFDRLFSKLHRDQTKASMAWLGYYLFKAPAYIMQLCPKKNYPDRFVMRSSASHYSAHQALNVERLLNTVPIVDAVFSVGEGTGVGQAWRARFKRKLKKLYWCSAEQRRRKKRKKGRVKMRRSNLQKKLRRMSKPMLGPSWRDVIAIIG